jgi:hypothetical protein
MQRIQYRIQDLDIQIKQKTQEENSAVRLVEVIDRPKALLAGQLNSKDGTPTIDANVLDKLIKSDYVGPLVERISKLQEAIQIMEADKARSEKQLSWLPKSSNSGSLPAEYNDLISRLSSELGSIVKNYNHLLDEYLTATIADLVIVKQPPLITSGKSLLLVLAGLFFVCIFLAIVAVGTERLFEKVQEKSESH